MKKIFTLIFVALFMAGTFAQNPDKISYQALVRNASNELVSNQTIGMRISIYQGSATGTLVYTETHTATTNANGIVTVEIGSGTVSGSAKLSSINWSSGSYFLKTETDPAGGSNYTISGTSQLLSVPYAMHAKTAESVSGTVTVTETDPVFTAWDKDYTDLTNKPTTSLSTAQVTKLNNIADGAEVNVQANWTESSSTSDAYIQNKPVTISAAQISKLSGIVDGAEVNVQADWSETVSTSDAFILNKPTIAALPAGTANYTLHYSGGSWVASGVLTNDGTDITTSGDLDIEGGILTVGEEASGVSVQGMIDFIDGDATTSITSSNGVVTIQAPTKITTAYTLTLPDAGPSAADKILKADASSNLSWVDLPDALPTGAEGKTLYYNLGNWVATDGITLSGTTISGYTLNVMGDIKATGGVLTVGNEDTGVGVRGLISLLDEDIAIGGYVDIQAPTKIPTAYTLTLPDAGPSAADQILKTDATGNLSWTDGLPGGNGNNQILVSNASGTLEWSSSHTANRILVSNSSGTLTWKSTDLSPHTPITTGETFDSMPVKRYSRSGSGSYSINTGKPVTIIRVFGHVDRNAIPIPDIGTGEYFTVTYGTNSIEISAVGATYSSKTYLVVVDYIEK